MENEEKLREKIELLLPLLNEQQKRLFPASEANYIGWGEISLISKLSNAGLGCNNYDEKKKTV